MTGLTNTAGEDALAPQPQIPDLSAQGADSQPPSLELEPWRDEVAARLARYRARRKPRAPRYPSLRLPFDPEPYSKPSHPERSRVSEASPSQSKDLCSASVITDDPCASPGAPRIVQHPADLKPPSASHFAQEEPSPPAPAPYVVPEPTAKVIEFPRSAAIPVYHTSSLAEPIFERPRILEAPEVVPPPPALGGILIEPSPALPPEPRADDTRIPSASIPRRLAATALDGLILLVSLSSFAAIFVRLNPVRQPVLMLAGVAASLAIVLWFVYQYLFVVYTGSTPGLRAARLQIAKFDGSPVPLRLRRWRVLASALSGLSAGLGYLWCLLDSNSLCWHDRITKTHLRTSHPSK
jgi:uncharacterized RDD family membrane protein YckC